MSLKSLWQNAAASEVSYPPLQGFTEVDVAVVGGGYTGLSTAVHLAEAGAKVAVAEAYQPGWGASGRNGGQVIPGLKYDPDDLVAMFGNEAGERLVEFTGSGPSLVFDLIEKYEMACDHRRCGWVQAAHNQQMVDLSARRVENWKRRGADVELLDRDALRDRLGSVSYCGGWLDRRGGALNPLLYARALAATAHGLGVSIFSTTPVTRLDRENERYRLMTPDGSLVAKQVVLATNGYTKALYGKLRQTVVPVHSFQVSTEELDSAVLSSVLPQGNVASDSRRVLLYFRKYGSRVLMGGVGTYNEPRGPSSFQHLERALKAIFPQVGECRFDHHWYGRVAMTVDRLPHLHEPLPGLVAALGYNGRGVALATAMGMVIAQRLGGACPDLLPFPTTTMRPIPFHVLRRLFVATTRAYYRVRDALG